MMTMMLLYIYISHKNKDLSINFDFLNKSLHDEKQQHSIQYNKMQLNETIIETITV